jgi:hypothetical protein
MTAAWTRKEGKNAKGGLNAKGRASYKAADWRDAKAPGQGWRQSTPRVIPCPDGRYAGADGKEWQAYPLGTGITGLGCVQQRRRQIQGRSNF